ncbi:MAG: Na(+)/H(+) antiporter subunit D [Balneolaceae bacterium]
MIVDFLLIPAVIVIIGGFILPLLPQNLRSSAFLVFPLIALATLWQLPDGYTLTLPFGSYELVPIYADSLSKIFGTIFAMIAVIGGIYAFHIKDLGQQSSALVYAGGALGVTFAGDYFTLYIFWELMAVSSAYLIWARRTKETDETGLRYLLVHIFGGGLLLGGILWHTSETGSILIESLPDVYSFSSVLILLGVAVNSAIPPLHAWLADAYPKATVTGAVFMSAFTTKSAVYVLIRIFPGWDILIWLGVAMALYGVVYAVLANDIRQILAYHIISQVGYMVAGVGIGTEMALNGTTAHAFSHILYKSLLFMGAGAVIYSTGKSKLTELGGFASKMKAVVFLYMIGAFSISGFPLFNGFISKSMVVSSAGEAHLEWVMLLLILASVGTFLHTGLKLPYFTWFGESKSKITVKPVPFNMLIAMGFGAFFCTLFGVAPGLLYQYLPYPVDYEPYTVYHLVEMTQILVFTFIGFWILRKKLEGDAKLALDTDWFYRRPASFVRKVFVDNVDRTFGVADDAILSTTRFLTGKFKNPMVWLNPFTDQSNEASRYSPGMEVVMSFIMFSFLILSLFYLL